VKTARGIKPKAAARGSSEKPQLFSDLVWIWEAFHYLNSVRPLGFSGPLPIPASEVLAYCTLKGVRSDEDLDDLLLLLPLLDRRWLSHHYEEDAKRKKKEADKKQKR